MTLHDNLELETTRRKLQLLEERYEAGKRASGDDHVRELSQQSLRRTINQLKEEIVRIEAHVGHVTRQ